MLLFFRSYIILLKLNAKQDSELTIIFLFKTRKHSMYIIKKKLVISTCHKCIPQINGNSAYPNSMVTKILGKNQTKIILILNIT